MFIAINRLRVPAEYTGRLEEAFGGRAGGMDGVTGFIAFDLLRKQTDDGPGDREYLVVTRWEDRASFEAWRQGDAFERAHSGTNPHSPVRSELSTYDVVVSRSHG